MSRELVLLGHKGMMERPTHILAGVDDLLASIEDSLLTINILRGSRYINPIMVNIANETNCLLIVYIKNV